MTTTPDETPASEAAASGLRHLTGPLARAVSLLAVFLSAAHLFLALFPWLSELERNIFHFAGFALLCALLYPATRGLVHSRAALAFDIVLGLAVATAAIYLALAEDPIYARGVRLIWSDWLAGSVVILGAIELSRRAAGPVIPILIILAMSYVMFWGSWISGVFSFPGLSAETVLFRSIYGDDALFGSIARISSTYVFLFIIFGAFLIRSGAGEFVIDLARVIAGKLTGGPGLVAVVASGLTGTISGSAIANTASTGVITIPLMKRAGYSPKFAAGVEAASSTGGQLMPPIMGAGAFVMAAFTQISYETIVAAAALPALLYFLSVAFFVRIEARRLNLPPLPAEGRTLGTALRDGGASFIIPDHRADRPSRLGLHPVLRRGDRRGHGDRLELAHQAPDGPPRDLGGARDGGAQHDHLRRAALLGRAHRQRHRHRRRRQHLQPDDRRLGRRQPPARHPADRHRLAGARHGPAGDGGLYRARHPLGARTRRHDLRSRGHRPHRHRHPAGHRPADPDARPPGRAGPPGRADALFRSRRPRAFPAARGRSAAARHERQPRGGPRRRSSPRT